MQIAIERLRELLRLDADGRLRNRVNRTSNARAGQVAGAIDWQGYVRLDIDCKKLQGSRVAYALTHGVWPAGQIDHIDGNRSNNRPENLRDVSPGENTQNQKVAQSCNKSGLLGVTAREGRKGKWTAQITSAGAVAYLGSFDSPTAAHAAYVAAKRVMHKTCTI